ncbi:MAG TPA: hypothetical protein PLZ51_08465, partial [Aggregatilineales bacterium]|nr:hypothetical protein [Aggregatilineales bacterium]
EFDGAVESFTLALALRPTDDSLYAHRANSYIGLRNAQSAINDLTSAIELAPEKGEYFFRRSRLYEALSILDVRRAEELGFTAP